MQSISLLFPKCACVLFQGDSITDGGRGRTSDPNHLLGHGYAYIIAARNGAAHPEQEWTFLNRGIGGNKVTDLDQRWQIDTLDLKPDVLSILIGINDLGGQVPAADFGRQYDALLTRTQRALPNTKLIVCEPFALPVGRLLQTWQRFRADLDERSAIVKNLAAKFDAVFLPLQNVFDNAAQQAPPEYWMWDGIHPSQSGHQLIADAWEAAVIEGATH